jgi:hypothetical protein
VGVVVQGLNKNVVDIAVATPQESEAITVVDEEIEAEAHAEGVELARSEQVFLESLLSYFSQGHRGNILHDLIEGEIKLGLDPRVEAFVPLAKPLDLEHDLVEERLGAAETDAQRHTQAEHPCQAVKKLVPRPLIAALHDEGSLICFDHEDSSSPVFRHGEGDDAD